MAEVERTFIKTYDNGFHMIDMAMKSKFMTEEQIMKKLWFQFECCVETGEVPFYVYR